MSQRIPQHRRIAVAIALAIAGITPAFAQNDREAALEARVAELEKLVQQLVAQKAAPAAAPAAAAPAAAPGTPPPPPPIQATTILPGETDTPIMETPYSVQVIPQQLLRDQQAVRLETALQNVSGVTRFDGSIDG